MMHAQNMHIKRLLVVVVILLTIYTLVLCYLLQRTIINYTPAVSTVSVIATTTPLKFTPETFDWVPLSKLPFSDFYIERNNKIYAGVYDGGPGRVLPGADPVTFVAAVFKEGTSTVSTGSGYTIYSKDKAHVFRYDTVTIDPVSVIDGADPGTFEPIYSHLGYGDGQYAKDKNRVYFMDQPIPGADAATFVPLLEEEGFASAYSKDAHHVWYIDIHDYIVLSAADPSSFSLEYDKSGHWMNEHARDRFHRFVYDNSSTSILCSPIAVVRFSPCGP
jgi:hypothetical protein